MYLIHEKKIFREKLGSLKKCIKIPLRKESTLKRNSKITNENVFRY